MEACLKAAPSYDAVINLGDIVGYGGSPNEVTDASRKLGGQFVHYTMNELVQKIEDRSGVSAN